LSWLQFIAAVVSSLALPTAAVLIVILLRQSILNLLPKLRRLKFKGFEVEFSEALKVVEMEAADLPEAVALPEASQAIESLQKVKINYSNNSAIFVAWLEVESAILNLSRSASILTPNTPASRAARLLLDQSLIDKTTYRTINDLYELRNVAVHTSDFQPISDQDVARFKLLADKITAVLENKRRAL
jgi:uncharacterized protein YutE (UPF0331/DUF86 family)